MNAEAQKTLRFHLPMPPGDGKSTHAQLIAEFNRFTLPFKASKTPVPKLLADLLKREARTVMRLITECPPDTLPAHIARLDFVMEACRFVITHDLVDAAECRLSGYQLANPSTLFDYQAALDITRQQHRSPVCLPHDEAQLNRIEAKLDTLAAWIGGVQ